MNGPLREKLAALIVAHQRLKSAPWSERIASAEHTLALALDLLAAIVDQLERRAGNE